MFDKNINKETGLPIDESYLECDLPKYLQESIEQMRNGWIKKETGEYYHWDLDYQELNADIGTAEYFGEISPRQANYLRKKYLKMTEVDL